MVASRHIHGGRGNYRGRVLAMAEHCSPRLGAAAVAGNLHGLAVHCGQEDGIVLQTNR